MEDFDISKATDKQIERHVREIYKNQPDGSVYSLGDFCFGGKDLAIEFEIAAFKWTRDYPNSDVDWVKDKKII